MFVLCSGGLSRCLLPGDLCRKARHVPLSWGQPFPAAHCSRTGRRWSPSSRRLLLAHPQPVRCGTARLALAYLEGSVLIFFRMFFPAAKIDPSLVCRRLCFANLPDTHKSRWGDELTAEKMKECIWLRPEAVAQIEFLEWTKDKALRNGIVNVAPRCWL